MNILLGVSGSVAAKLTPKLRLAFQEYGEVKIIVTKSALHFIPVEFVPTETPKYYFTDEDELSWRQKGDIIHHIDLRAWADLIVVAPLTANTLSKISTGAADNILTNTIRAWDYNKPMYLVPVMNESMWENPFTYSQLGIMQGLGAKVIEPVVKTMMCGETGKGAMPQIKDIVNFVVEDYESR